jgi:enoyl-CoA hydratase
MADLRQPRIEIAIRQPQAGARVAWITISNESMLNALNSPLMDQFLGMLREAALDEQLRAVVITGAGEKAFSGGADVGELARLDAVSARDFITRLHRCCQALRDLPVPVIARIQGYALGAGLELAASCDLRIAADCAIFGMPEVKLGIPSVIEAALLPPLVGWGRAREILYLGENFIASDALAWGLVERVVPRETLDDAVEKCIESLLRTGPRAIRLQKKLIRSWEDLPLRAAIDAGIDSLAAAYEGDEPQLAMQSFLAARRSRKLG